MTYILKIKFLSYAGKMLYKNKKGNKPDFISVKTASGAANTPARATKAFLHTTK
jgi:hypothetical protein